MFTGLIECMGKVSHIAFKGDVRRIDIEAPLIAPALRCGDSVSVSGVCCSIASCGGCGFAFEIMPETRNRTTLGYLKDGAFVNLERAMSLDSRLDGHIVSGHIDGLGVVQSIVRGTNTAKYFFSASSEILRGIVKKGSVAIDGVSLTAIDADSEVFSVGLIPTTLAATTISLLKTGDAVNIETDVIGKYVLRFLELRFRGEDANQEMRNSLTWDKLAKYGWT